MSQVRVATRYAQGLFSFAKDEGKAEQFVSEMKGINETVEASRELQFFLNNPTLKANQKETTLLTIFEKSSESVKNLISLLVKNGRESALSVVADQYVKLYNKENNIFTVEIITASEIDSTVKDLIVEKVKAKLLPKEATVELSTKVDESLLGGFIARAAGKELDSSLKTKISTLKSSFSENKYIPK